MSSPSIKPADRLSFTLFVAAAFHAMVLLGITFSPTDSHSASKTLELTLARNSNEKAPDDADFLAQANQQGSGTLEEKRQLTTTEIAELQDNNVQKTSPVEQQASAPKQQKKQSKLITTTAQSKLKIQQNKVEESDVNSTQPDGPQRNLLQRSREIASLEAKLSHQQQIYAKRPKVYRLTAASTKKAEDAFYLRSIQDKIETVGRTNYPTEALRCITDNDCSLRMSIIINKDGTIHKIEILESSGRAALDQAAKQIARRVAPYPPFDENLAQAGFDHIDLIRTWRFKGRQLVTN
jgi:protein TonB